MSTVLIAATRYDATTRLLHGWAVDLEAALKGQGHSCTFLSGPAVTVAALAAGAASADVIVFFGHGEADKLIGQRGRFSSGGGPVLVDGASVATLAGKQTYAVCCQALIQLGPAFGSAYPSSCFLGYAAPFGFSTSNHADFRAVVNDSAADLVAGASGMNVVASLQQAWRALADDFLNGGRASRPDAFVAGFAAAANSIYVGLSP